MPKWSQYIILLLEGIIAADLARFAAKMVPKHNLTTLEGIIAADLASLADKMVPTYNLTIREQAQGGEGADTPGQYISLSS